MVPQPLCQRAFPKLLTVRRVTKRMDPSSPIVMQRAEREEPVLNGPEAQDRRPFEVYDVVVAQVHPDLRAAHGQKALEQTEIVVVADRRPDRTPACQM